MTEQGVIGQVSPNLVGGRPIEEREEEEDDCKGGGGEGNQKEGLEKLERESLGKNKKEKEKPESLF